MAHREQKMFCQYVRYLHQDYFVGKDVLDVGSRDVNGNNRYLFENCNYLGCDITSGDNVDIVSKIHEYQGEDESFDTIISTECLEHDENYVSSLRSIMRMLKPNGIFIMSCATTGRPEHGTLNTDGDSSCPQLNTNYYKNLTEQDIREALPSIVEEVFSSFNFAVNEKSCDLYFWGIKK